MKKALALTALGLMLVAASALAQSFGPTGTTQLSVAVAAEAQIEINTATTSFSTSSSFADYTGTTNLTYKIRTSKTAGTGTGSIVVQITSDFAPTGGPTVGGTQLTSSDTPTYVCSASSPATACSGSVTPSTTSSTSVYGFGADNHSAKAGNTGSVTWTVPNDPLYPTGTYLATATFTISAT